MQCKYCLEKMDLYSTEGCGTYEESHYVCAMCESEVKIYENGTDSEWIHGGK